MSEWLAFVGGLLVGVQFIEWLPATCYLVLSPFWWATRRVMEKNRAIRVLVGLPGTLVFLGLLPLLFASFVATIAVRIVNGLLNNLLRLSVQPEIHTFTNITRWIIRMRSHQLAESVSDSNVQNALDSRPIPFIGVVGFILIVLSFGLALVSTNAST